jgi:hypothetical protein
MKLYDCKNGIVHADAAGFQVYSADFQNFLSTASPFCYPNSMLRQTQNFQGNIVIIADGFNGSNFCHFALDWLTRINAFITLSGRGCRETKFLATGIPNEFHEMLIDCLIEELGLDPSSIIFLAKPTTMKVMGDIFWFSDSFESNTHPGYLMDKTTRAFLSRIAFRLRQINRTKLFGPNIYISRSDATGRRVANEDEIQVLLRDRQFQVVELSKFSVREQCSIVSEATCIVAPHGMGLTYIAFNRNKPRIIELFHPKIGTDAYTVVARAMGADYSYIVGEAAGGSDFYVSVDVLQEQLS